jgi:hypothetical protein
MFRTKKTIINIIINNNQNVLIFIYNISINMENYISVLRKKYLFTQKYFNINISNKKKNIDISEIYHMLNMAPLYPILVKLPIQYKNYPSVENISIFINNKEKNKNMPTNIIYEKKYIDKYNIVMENFNNKIIKNYFKYRKPIYFDKYIDINWLQLYETIRNGTIYNTDNNIDNNMIYHLDITYLSYDGKNPIEYHIEKNLNKKYKKKIMTDTVFDKGIYKKKLIKYVEKYSKYSFDIITINISDNSNIFFTKLFQIYVFMLCMLKKTTTCILKINNIYCTNILHLLCLSTMMFDHVQFCKPVIREISDVSFYIVLRNIKQHHSTTTINEMCNWFELYDNHKICLMKDKYVNDIFVDNIKIITKIIYYNAIILCNCLYFYNTNYEVIKNTKNLYISKKTHDEYMIKFYLYINDIKSNIPPVSYGRHLVSIEREQIRYIFDVNPIFYNDNYMYYIEGITYSTYYKYQNIKPINFDDKNNTDYYYEEKIHTFNIVDNINFIKDKRLALILVQKYYPICNLYYDYYDVIILDKLLKCAKKHNLKIEKVVYNFLFDNNFSYKTFNVTKKQNKDYITKKHNVTIEINDIFLKQKSKDNSHHGTLHIYIYLRDNNYRINDNISNNNIQKKPTLEYHNIIVKNILKKVISMNEKSALVLGLTMNNIITFDLINLISNYFEFTIVNSYKYMYNHNIFIIFINKKNISASTCNYLKKIYKKSFYRLYTEDIMEQNITFIKNVVEINKHRMLMLTDLLQQCIDRTQYYDIFIEGVQNMKELFSRKYKTKIENFLINNTH